MQKKPLTKIVKKYQIEVIHSNLFKIDCLITETFFKSPVKIVTTIHGDFLDFFESPKTKTILNYSKKVKLIEKRMNKIVCISDKQVNFFENTLTFSPSKITKVYNGYKKNSEIKSIKKDLGLKEDSFVYGMIARGIPDKGWQFAIDAFEKNNIDNTLLILVGDGEYLKSLQEKYKHNNKIIFGGATGRPLDWINIFDVGLLPSIYKAESLPTSIIEYLCMGKPVIASDAGEINKMLETGNNNAGFVIPIQSQTINVTEMAEKMNLYFNDKSLYQQHSSFALQAFKKFDMDLCISNYLSIYKEVL